MSVITISLVFLVGIAAGALIFAFKYVSVSRDNAAKEQKIKDLLDALNDRATAQNSLKTEFENIASKVLDEKNSKISDLNKQALETVISPFKEKIDEFKAKIEKIYVDETSQRAVFGSELNRLMELNKKVSEEANNLASALKGESKLQGIWGELGIERIFESAGMVKDVHYKAQYYSDNGEEVKIPDYVINLPENKHIIIDSKTSLTAYERYYNSQTDDEKKVFLKEHILSVKKHIDELSEKNYDDIAGLNQPDYIFMFIPLDSAASLALQNEPKLAELAFKNRIVIITPSSLLATMKTIAYIWRQEDQKKNVLEIAKQGGLLYDRFVDFVEIIKDADSYIDKAKSKTQDAIKKLSNPDRKGESLIGRAEKLKELGVAVKKDMPQLTEDNN
ncbi:MAG: DNA recombination protein RmuC [Endomicrobia bacterium]|nr:DNA recombination protein RmuC [Endomicrobiia bacterium]MCL2506112.1 DNA recombination protein RmuC [Endomicrobiia bacterium]